MDPDWVDCYWEDNPSHLRESGRRQEEEGKLCTLLSVLTVKPERPEHAQWVKAETVIQRTMKNHRTNNSVWDEEVLSGLQLTLFLNPGKQGSKRLFSSPFILSPSYQMCLHSASGGAKNTMSKIQTIALKKLMHLYFQVKPRRDEAVLCFGFGREGGLSLKN